MESIDNFLKLQQNQKIDYTLFLDGNAILLSDVEVSKTEVPVSEPTTRGGVYFSEKFAYKIKATIHDVSIIPLLSKMMLGPSPEFGEIKIKTNVNYDDGKTREFTFVTNLTNSMQSSSKVILFLTIIGIESD